MAAASSASPLVVAEPDPLAEPATAATGTTSFARPIANAVRASMFSPPVTSSIAFDRPMIRGARTVPPQPGNRPSFTSGKPYAVLSLSVNMRRSHQIASSAPPPTHMPSIAATDT